MSTIPKTCHSFPWALVVRGGQVAGQRPRTKLVYLTGTVAPDGRAIAITGRVIIRGDFSKTTRRFEWNDIVARWAAQPKPAKIAAARAKLAPAAKP